MNGVSVVVAVCILGEVSVLVVKLCNGLGLDNLVAVCANDFGRAFVVAVGALGDNRGGVLVIADHERSADGLACNSCADRLGAALASADGNGSVCIKSVVGVTDIGNLGNAAERDRCVGVRKHAVVCFDVHSDDRGGACLSVYGGDNCVSRGLGESVSGSGESGSRACGMSDLEAVLAAFKSLIADCGAVIEHVSHCEVGAVPESLFHDRGAGGGNGDLCEAYAIPKSCAADGLNCAESNGSEARAVPESKPGNGLHLLAEYYVGELFASCECHFTDSLNIVSDNNGGNCGTVESISADSGYGVGTLRVLDVLGNGDRAVSGVSGRSSCRNRC